MNIAEMKHAKNELIVRAREIHEGAEKESRDLEASELGNFEALRQDAAALDNRIQRAVLVSSGTIRPPDLGLDERTTAERPSAPPTSIGGAPASGTLTELEREAIEAALGRAQGVVSRAATELGVSRQALYRRMERLGIEIERRVR